MRSHAHTIYFICTALVLLFFGGMSGCSDATAPQLETLGSFRLSAPTLIAAGETVTMTIEAVGTQDTRPFTEFNGDVLLAASIGEVTPDVVTLTEGRATVDITLSASDGVVQLSASGANAAGAISIDVSALTALPGDPSDNASAAIPDLDYAPTATDFDGSHPDLAGFSVSLNTVLINFTPAATVGEVNDVITRVGGLIVGGIPGESSGVGGMLMLRVPAGTHAEMDAMVTALEAEAAIEFVERDLVNEVTFVPDSSNQLALWSWEFGPAGGNWGMEMCRMPQMWNLNSAIAKRGDPTILTGIVDAGFDEHNDLAFRRVYGNETHFHGTHVAGTIAAGFHNERGIDGVSPFAQLRVASPVLLTNGTIAQAVVALAYEGCRVVNLSLGTAWSDHPDNSPIAVFFLGRAAQQMMDAFEPLRDTGIMPLLVSSAGNESDDFATPVQARHGGPINHAALELGFDDIIVVEAIELENDGRRLEMSNLNGHVSAPGGAVLSTTPNNSFGLASGTSMATPHVTGLASFLLSIDPSLTNAELMLLITSNTQPTSPNFGFAASPRIDAFAAALAIDGLRGGDEVVRMLIDIDDGTPDGNLRVSPTDPSATFTDEDADGDGGIGDGRIDMCDFRRWRDWFHQVDGTTGATFDGIVNHGKRDVNGDRRADDPATEGIYPRADFNGDGTLNIDSSVVPGESPVPRTDFGMLVRHFDDSAFQEAMLVQLIHSGDVYVDLSQYVNSGRFNEVTSEVRSSTGDLLEFHEHTAGEPAYVYTLVSGESYQVTAWGISGGDTVCTNSGQFEVGLCSDAYWLPECPGVDIAITLAEFIEAGTASPLLVRAGILNSSGGVDYKAGIQLDISTTGGGVAAANGVTDSDGFFDTEVTMGASSQQLNVFVTATDPATGESAVAQATALPFGSDGVSVTMTFRSASAHTYAGIGTSSDQEVVADSAPFLNETSFGGQASAGASASQGDNGASANASGAVDGTAIWARPGMLSALSMSGTGSASVSTTGPFTQGYAASAGGGYSVNFEFDVDSNGIEVRGSSSGDLGLRILSTNGNTFWSRDETKTVQLVAGHYRVFMSGGATEGAEPPPFSASASAAGSANLQFSAPSVSMSATRR